MDMVKHGESSKALGKTTAQLSAFLNKLYTMVNDPSTDHLIRWSAQGDSFQVLNQERAAKELLPKYFKHSNFGSFVRQLNMYGFSKVLNINAGVLDPSRNSTAMSEETDENISERLEFRNENFQRGEPDLMLRIHRKKAGDKIHVNASDAPVLNDRALVANYIRPSGDDSALAIDLRTLLSEVSAIRKHQTAIAADLKELSVSNKQLWTEAIESRTRHSKHQDTINRIVNFLGSVFGGKVLERGSDSNTVNDSSNDTVSNTSRRKEAARPSPPKKRRLLIKGREDDTAAQGGASIQEIEIPSMEGTQTLSHVSTAPISGEPLFQSSAAYELDNLNAVQHPSTTSFDRIASPPQDSSASPDCQVARLLQQSNHIDSATRDYSKIASQMDDLQTALDKIVANLPNDVVGTASVHGGASGNPYGASLPVSDPAQFDLDSFLQQFSNADSYSSTSPLLYPNASSQSATSTNWNAPIDWDQLLGSTNINSYHEGTPSRPGVNVPMLDASFPDAVRSNGHLSDESVRETSAHAVDGPKIWETMSNKSLSRGHTPQSETIVVDPVSDSVKPHQSNARRASKRKRPQDT